MSSVDPPSLTELAQEVRHGGVLLERLSSKVDAIVEGIGALTDHVTRTAGDLEARLSARIQLLEEVVRQNSVDIRQNTAGIRQNTADIQQSSADIQSLRREIAGLRHDFDHREERGRM